MTRLKSIKKVKLLPFEPVRERERGMGSRALVPSPTNCGKNASISPSPKTTHLLSSAASQRRWLPAFTRRSSWPLKLRAEAGNGGAVGELLASAAGNFYELLGIPVSGSCDEIKSAYKQLAKKYHPDVSPAELSEEYTQRFIKMQEAYETLSDPWSRALYDRYLARGLHLTFSTRRQFDEELEEKSGWKNRWQDQLAELKRRGMTMNSEDNLSWGARMRRRRAECSAV